MAELSHRRWRNLRQQILNTHPPICHLCGKPIDRTLPGTHPQGPTVDHIHPRNRGGNTWDPRNLKPAHLTCNSAKRDRTPHRRTQSRNW